MSENKETHNEEESPEIYHFPDNYTNSGKVINGMLDLRNLIEGLIVSVILGFIEYLFIMNFNSIKIFAIIVITIGPILIASIIGINGDSISQFVLLFINFLKNKRKLRYRRIMKNEKTANSRSKTRPTNTKKKTSRK